MLVFRRHNFGILVFYLHVYTMYFWAVQISASVFWMTRGMNLFYFRHHCIQKWSGSSQKEQMIEKSALKYTTKENGRFQ